MLNGDGIGSLRVDIVYDNGDREILWKLSGEKSKQWTEGQVGFGSRGMTYR